MSELQTLKTAIHEIAHSKLHAIDPEAPAIEQADRPDSRTREVHHLAAFGEGDAGVTIVEFK